MTTSVAEINGMNGIVGAKPCARRLFFEKNVRCTPMGVGEVGSRR